jgi:Fe-S oxidoreductase
MLIEQQFATIDACRFCFMCRHVCTAGVVSGWESDTPRGKGLILFKVLKGYATYSDDLVATIYRCCLCGMCQTWCEGEYTMPQAVLLARRDIVEQSKEPEGARKIRANILETGNPFGLPAQDRFKAIENGKVFKDQAQVLYYVGCDTAYHQPEIASAFVKILLRSGIDFTLLRDETSAGKPLSVLGYHSEAKQLAQGLAAKIRSAGSKILVTTCPSSYDAFKNDYAAMGVDLGGIEVLHATQYVARLVNSGRLTPRKPLSRSVTPQDSTYLCRFNDGCDELRRVLQSIPGVDLKEMSWTRDRAHSCGEAGGVLPLLYPELNRELAKRMLEEANRTGAQVLATTCPATKRSLASVNETGMEIRDVVELFAESL